MRAYCVYAGTLHTIKKNKMRILNIFLVIILMTQSLVGQNEINPEEVIENYLKAIGGRENLEKVETIVKSGNQMIKGENHKVEVKIIRNEAFSMNREFSKGKMSAIVLKGEGVNITPEGTFNMPPYQVKRYEKDSKIFPELSYLDGKHILKYHGVYELDSDTKCYEIGITYPDSSTIYKEYNIETGLLELIVNKREKTRITEYQETNGILFPKVIIANGVQHKSQKIEINPKIEKSDFNWNSEKELKLVGRWGAQTGENELGQAQILFIELTSNRAGKEGMGLVVDGKKVENEFMNQNIVGWELEESKIKLQYYNPNKKQLWSKYLAIKEMENEKIVGFISDPEMDKMFGDEVKPIEMEFKKIKK